MSEPRIKTVPSPTIGLMGTGTVGFGWANVFRRLGLQLILFDEQRAAAEALRARVLGGDGDEATVSVAASLEEFATQADYIQESVPEDLDTKRRVFSELDTVAAPDVVLASSASGLPISAIAADVTHLERCLVVHPTNPPHIVPLVEIVPCEATSEAVTQAALDFMVRLGQSPVVVRREIFGFVLNRLQFALTREAFRLVREGVVSVGDVERTLSDGLALRWAFLGPYGVEATNAPSIEDDLRKFGPLIKSLFDEVGQPFDGPTEEDVQLAIEGVSDLFGEAKQEDLVAYRDAMVLKLRELKADRPLPVGPKLETPGGANA